MRHKFKVAPANERTWNGRVYASKAEMLYAQLLADWEYLGSVAWWLEQPLFRLGCPENTYRPDFLVCWRETDGSEWCQAVDVKGVMTASFKKNVKLWRQYAPMSLKIVTRVRAGKWDAEVVDGKPRTRKA
jgi:hypothetical protein